MYMSKILIYTHKSRHLSPNIEHSHDTRVFHFDKPPKQQFVFVREQGVVDVTLTNAAGSHCTIQWRFLLYNDVVGLISFLKEYFL